MATYSAAVQTSAGDSTHAIAALVGNGSVPACIREIGIFNTTTTAVDVQLVRISTAGTPGSSATTLVESNAGGTATAVLKGTYTSTAPTQVVGGRRAQLGAAAGSGVVWTFPDGLWVAAVSNAAVGVIPTGTGQVCDVYFVWSE